jgi:hypothetical protein
MNFNGEEEGEAETEGEVEGEACGKADGDMNDAAQMLMNLWDRNN